MGTSYSLIYSFISTDFKVKDSNSFQRMHQCHIFYIKDKVARFDLAKNRSRSTQGYNFNKLKLAAVSDDTYQVSLKLFHWVQGRKALKDFTIHGHGGHLGHVTSIMLSIFLFPCTLKLTNKIWLKVTHWFLRKTSFNFHM